MSNDRSKFGNAVRGTVAGLALLLATSCGTAKHSQYYNLHHKDATTEETTSSSKINPDSTAFGIRYAANKVMTEKEQLALRNVLYPENPGKTIAHENVYLTPVVVGNDTTGFEMKVVSDVMRCTDISKEAGLLIEKRANSYENNLAKKTPSKPVKKDSLKQRHLGLGISPEARFENGSVVPGLSADLSLYNVLFTVKLPNKNSNYVLDDYSDIDSRRQNSPRNITYVLTNVKNEGSLKQDFDFGLGVGYQVNLGHINLGLTGNMQKSTVKSSTSTEEVSKNVYSSFTDEFIEPENASLIPRSETNEITSGHYAGGEVRASYQFNNGLELGLKGGLMVPLKDIKEFDFNGSKVKTNPVQNIGLMLRYNF